MITTLTTIQSSFAGINLAAGGSTGMNTTAENPMGQSFMLSGEFTLNVFKILEAGLFYDHNFGTGDDFNLTGATARLGLGPLLGLFVDGKLGVTTTHAGVGAGVGLGYRFNDTFGVRAGPRVIGGVLGAQVIADAGLMLYL